MVIFFFFSSRRRHTRSLRDWSSDVCSSDLNRSSLRRLPRTGERFHHHGFHGGVVLAPAFGGLWLGTGLGWPYYSYPDESYYGYGPYGQYWYCDNPPGYYPYVQQYSHASRHQCCRQCAHRRRHHHDIIDQNVDAAIGSDGGLDQPAEISARVYRGVPLFGRTELLIRDPQLSFDGRCY